MSRDYLQFYWLCTNSCRAHGSMTNVARPSSRCAILKVICAGVGRVWEQDYYHNIYEDWCLNDRLDCECNHLCNLALTYTPPELFLNIYCFLKVKFTHFSGSMMLNWGMPFALWLRNTFFSLKPWCSVSSTAATHSTGGVPSGVVIYNFSGSMSFVGASSFSSPFNTFLRFVSTLQISKETSMIRVVVEKLNKHMIS